MNLPTVLGVGALGGLGALIRFVLDGVVSRRAGRDFPYGTLAVNLSGAACLGLLVGLVLSGSAYELFGTGLVGGYTTFSTWMLECHRLAEDGRVRASAVNWSVSVVLGVAAAVLGRHIGELL